MRNAAPCNCHDSEQRTCEIPASEGNPGFAKKRSALYSSATPEKLDLPKHTGKLKSISAIIAYILLIYRRFYDFLKSTTGQQ
jgi:hypothetical protein